MIAESDDAAPNTAQYSQSKNSLHVARTLEYDDKLIVQRSQSSIKMLAPLPMHPSKGHGNSILEDETPEINKAHCHWHFRW
jgi:hypothetical protein